MQNDKNFKIHLHYQNVAYVVFYLKMKIDIL